MMCVFNITLHASCYYSVEPKCPNTVPAKPSRSRVSRLAMISSIPHKGNNLRSKEVKAISTSKIATPKTKAVKGKESSSVPHKALTERKKKQMQSPAAFRSVQHPRPAAATRATESRVVAKALVFGSPKKLVKLKRSVERKLEVGSKIKGLGVNNKVEASTTPSKTPLRTREVKSRVFDSVLSQKKQIGEKVKGSATLKKRVKEKKEPVVSSDPSKAHEAKGKEHENQFLVENKSEENALALDCDDKENATIVTVDREDTCVLDKVKQSGETTETEDKENVANASDVDAENDDKENASALDNNRFCKLLLIWFTLDPICTENLTRYILVLSESCRKVDQSPSPMVKRKVFGRKETCKTTPKVYKFILYTFLMRSSHVYIMCC